jgi:glycosyltransferase involved in cell wall biosynthesis
MFDLTTIARHRYTDPWNLSLTQRLKQLRQRSTRIAYFYEQADNSTFRYRVYNPAQVLNSLDERVSASYFFLADLDALDDIVEACDALVICRVRYCHRVARLLTRFRARGKPVYFDVDDLVFDIDHAHLVANTINLRLDAQPEWDQWFGYVGRIGTTMRQCDGTIVTNPFLGAVAESFSQRPARIMRNFANREQLAMSDQVFELKAAAGHRGDGYVHIGYFSGTPTHVHDVQVAMPALCKILRRNRHVRLVIAGFWHGTPWPSDVSQQVERLEFTDFINLQINVGLVDLNIVPLQTNTFTNCKSELKYFEAGLVGTPTVASRTATYSAAIDHGVNGLLAAVDEWEDHLQTLIDAPATRARLALAGRAHALTHYAWTSTLAEVRGALRLD